MGDNQYRIMMAVAGFGENDLEITAQENLLVVTGKLGEPRETGTTYLYRGIATRAFERRFSLADHVKIVGATLTDGVLQVELERELPEAISPPDRRREQARFGPEGNRGQEGGRSQEAGRGQEGRLIDLRSTVAPRAGQRRRGASAMWRAPFSFVGSFVIRINLLLVVSCHWFSAARCAENSLPLEVILLKNLKRSLSVDRIRVVFFAMMDL